MPRSKRKGSVVKRDRKIILYIATSADGHIARPDGGVSRLHYAPHHDPSPALGGRRDLVPTRSGKRHGPPRKAACECNACERSADWRMT
jgi:hypothetical protein